MIESRLLSELLPIVAGHAIVAIAKTEMQTGLKIIVTATFRDDEMQRFYYEQGRSREGRIITNDPGPKSSHSLRIALDIAPAIKDLHTGQTKLFYETSKWEEIAKYFKEQHFVWGGDWKSFKDRPHFQWTKFQTLDEIRAGKPVFNSTLCGE